MNYKLEPWVHEALRTLPVIRRAKLRWWLHVRLNRAAYHDERLAALQNRMDCGFQLGDYITGGKFSREVAARDAILEEIVPVMQDLRKRVPHSGDQEECSE